jgi:uncharacterized protein YqjF (DUF2071 family)
MIPVLEGTIARRVLLNFRADPDVAQRLVPKPLEVVVQNGFAMVGVCLIRLEQLRPKGFPASLGMASENMAHRIAVRYPTDNGMKEGVFIWRRETDLRLATILGGRLFPGVHRQATFHVMECEGALAMYVRTRQGQADVSFDARYTTDWTATTAFRTLDEACRFFQKGDCGFSCSQHGRKLEGTRLRTLKWEMRPLRVGGVQAAFYENRERFPAGSIEFDSAVIMCGIPHEWYELDDVPELAGAVTNKLLS